MARCPDCCKFVSIEMGEPEIQNLEIDDFGDFDGEVRLVKLCADCGTELAETYVEIDDSGIEHSHDEAEGYLSVVDDEVVQTERYEGKGRYAKTFYGAMIRAYVECSLCDFREWKTLEVEEQASNFDDLT